MSPTNWHKKRAHLDTPAIPTMITPLTLRFAIGLLDGLFRGLEVGRSFIGWSFEYGAGSAA